jgi:3-oxoacyl-[acyl-carrier-protein] synthase III
VTGSATATWRGQPAVAVATASTLSLVGLGFDLPPAVDVVALAAAKGVDTSGYESWRNACHVRSDQDHPSTMGATALDRALSDAGLPVSSLDLVIFTGISRDYVPSWSVATEIMRLLGAPPTCLGLDLTLGCAATLSGLDLARGWLAQRGSGYAAVVAAERWSYTVDPVRPESRTWAWADGAAAVVAGAGAPSGFADFLGAEFTTHASYNGHVLIQYGGTRYPAAPAGVDALTRVVSSRPRDEIRETYARCYTTAYDRLARRVGVRGKRLVCNQISPRIVRMVADGLGIGEDQVVLTGHEFGHLGAADILVGLQQLRDSGQLDCPIVLGSSTPYAFGVGMVAPAGARLP